MNYFFVLELLSVNQPQILNLKDILNELTNAVLSESEITLHFGYGTIGFRTLAQKKHYCLCLKSIKTCGSLPKRQLFRVIRFISLSLEEAFSSIQNIRVVILKPKYLSSASL